MTQQEEGLHLGQVVLVLHFVGVAADSCWEGLWHLVDSHLGVLQVGSFRLHPGVGHYMIQGAVRSCWGAGLQVRLSMKIRNGWEEGAGLPR